jgi:hypothetical protein
MHVPGMCVLHGGVVRHRRLAILSASVWLALACSDDPGATIERTGTRPDNQAGPPAGGTLVAPLTVAALRPPASGTTPDALEITLGSNLDSLSVRTKITDPTGVPLTECEVAEVYRVGPSAVSWPIGSALELSLGYAPAGLPDGVYVHAVSMGIGAFGNHWLPTNVSQYFALDRGVFQTLTGEEFEQATGLAEPGESAVMDPCPPLPDYSDEMPADGATSRVELDSWQGLGTIQPLRWVGSATRPFVGQLPSILTFHALLAGRGRLQLDLVTPSDKPSDFEATFPEGGRVLLDEVGPDGATMLSWGTLSGTARVNVDDSGQARVDLADLVFSRSRRATNPESQRSVATAVLTGEVIAEEWP